jgi:hypothetical protein
LDDSKIKLHPWQALYVVLKVASLTAAAILIAYFLVYMKLGKIGSAKSQKLDFNLVHDLSYDMTSSLLPFLFQLSLYKQDVLNRMSCLIDQNSQA